MKKMKLHGLMPVISSTLAPAELKSAEAEVIRIHPRQRWGLLRRRIISFWLPPVLWMGLIFFLSSFHKLQASPVGWQDFIIRKLAHFCEYAILCFLYYRGLKNTTKLTLVKGMLLAFFLTVFYALSDEYHQTFINGRTGRSFDIGVDFFGATFGLFFSWKLVNVLPERIKKAIL